MDVIPINDAGVHKAGSEVIAAWDILTFDDSESLTLDDGDYKCPRCGKFALRFGADADGHGLAMWD